MESACFSLLSLETGLELGSGHGCLVTHSIFPGPWLKYSVLPRYLLFRNRGGYRYRDCTTMNTLTPLLWSGVPSKAALKIGVFE